MLFATTENIKDRELDDNKTSCIIENQNDEAKTKEKNMIIGRTKKNKERNK